MVLSGDQGNAVQGGLCLFVNGNGGSHNRINHNRDQRHCDQKDQSDLPVNGKGHDHRTHNNKGGAKEQTKHHVDTCLCLVYVIGDPGHKGRGSKLV